ncbi:hypothetical protein OUZ56_011537 [Daphnia magna]|uniref:Uncharacterized protein n=1 Tax=Daphnia magna TaxID=35525 RepID=A0ABQ9Z0N6_9CRUS|nr:hypothetical protein OUZ56_011537 [Daphnia magna]
MLMFNNKLKKEEIAKLGIKLSLSFLASEDLNDIVIHSKPPHFPVVQRELFIVGGLGRASCYIDEESGYAHESGYDGLWGDDLGLFHELLPVEQGCHGDICHDGPLNIDPYIILFASSRRAGLPRGFSS